MKAIILIHVGCIMEKAIGPFDSEDLAREWARNNIDARVFPWRTVLLGNP